MGLTTDIKATNYDIPEAVMGRVFEAAVAFQGMDVEGGVPSHVQNTLVKSQRVTPQAAAELKNVLCSRSDINDPMVAQLLQEIASCIGEPVASLESVRQQVERVVTSADGRSNQANDPAVRMQQMWARIEELNEQIGDDMESLYRRGRVSREEYEAYRRERARIDAMPQGEARANAEGQLAERTGQTADRAAEQDRREGLPPQGDAQRMRDNSDEVGQNAFELGAEYRQAAQIEQERANIARNEQRNPGVELELSSLAPATPISPLQDANGQQPVHGVDRLPQGGGSGLRLG